LPADHIAGTPLAISFGVVCDGPGRGRLGEAVSPRTPKDPEDAAPAERVGEAKADHSSRRTRTDAPHHGSPS